MASRISSQLARKVDAELHSAATSGSIARIYCVAAAALDLALKLLLSARCQAHNTVYAGQSPLHGPPTAKNGCVVAAGADVEPRGRVGAGIKRKRP